MPVGFHMGMGRVGPVKATPVPVNTVPACRGVSKKNLWVVKNLQFFDSKTVLDEM